MTDRDFWLRQRALLIEQAKALAAQRAAIIGQYKTIERMLEMPPESPAPTQTETFMTLPPLHTGDVSK